MSSDVPKPGSRQEDSRAEAFEKEYRESHPNGPYPQLETASKKETKAS